MKEPRMPDFTCPLIDEVISNTNKAHKLISGMEYGSVDFNDVKEVETYLSGVEDTMEKIRKANEQLRACAEYWKEEFENKEKDVEKLEDQITDLKYDLTSSNNEIKELEYELRATRLSGGDNEQTI
jgi:uncharacterized coiled-coil DUF342 family protein